MTSWVRGNRSRGRPWYHAPTAQVSAPPVREAPAHVGGQAALLDQHQRHERAGAEERAGEDRAQRHQGGQAARQAQGSVRQQPRNAWGQQDDGRADEREGPPRQLLTGVLEQTRSGRGRRGRHQAAARPDGVAGRDTSMPRRCGTTRSVALDEQRQDQQEHGAPGHLVGEQPGDRAGRRAPGRSSRRTWPRTPAAAGTPGRRERRRRTAPRR